MGWFAARAAAVLILVTTLCGCVSSGRASLHRSGSIGVCYSPEKAIRSSPARGLDVIERDLATISKMHLDTVIIRHLRPESIALVLEQAAEHGLKLVLPDARAIRRVKGISQIATQSGGDPPLPRSPIVVGYYLGDIVDTETHARALKEAQRLGRLRLASCVRIDPDIVANVDVSAFDCVIAMNSERSGGLRKGAGGRIFQTLSCRSARSGDDAAARAWLRDYHRGLSRGQTGGVIFEAFRTFPGDGEGLVPQDATLSPERISTVQRITSRAKRWHRVLAGLVPAPVTPTEILPDNIEVTLLAKGKRRCLLIANTSTRDFSRGKVVLPIELNAGAVVRAVAVPADSDAGLGDVIPVRTDRLVIPVELAPGDGLLYELF
ncbi:MAG: hypothetical protein GXP29_10960 [Planctomycetes bacterium]|nr:hypothetical protein [Planctomycetota bacterium]